MQIASLFDRYREAQAVSRSVSAKQAALSGDDAVAMEDELAGAFDRQFSLERQIISTPADSLAGIHGKLVHCLESARENAPDGELETDWQMVESATNDLERIIVPVPQPVSNDGGGGGLRRSSLLAAIGCLLASVWFMDSVPAGAARSILASPLEAIAEIFDQD